MYDIYNEHLSRVILGGLFFNYFDGKYVFLKTPNTFCE